MKRLAVLFFCMLLSVGAWAADLNVSDAWIRILPGGAPAGGKVAFAPGSYHLMLMQPTRKITAGDRIQVTLEVCRGSEARRGISGPGADWKVAN